MSDSQSKFSAALPTRPIRLARLAAVVVAALCFLLIVHNFAIRIIPGQRLRIPKAEIQVFEPGRPYAYSLPLPHVEPNQQYSARSAVRFFENGEEYTTRSAPLEEISSVGGMRFNHQNGRLLFSSSDNSDPRTNGRLYEVELPVAYGNGVGIAASLGFFASLLWLRKLSRIRDGSSFEPKIESTAAWRIHLAGATLLLGIGIYCNTGTLAPYAITTTPIVDPNTGYAYNPDHVHFHVLTDFLEGRERELWNKAILSRRILFTVLAWPFTHLLGFEVGGEIASIVYNILGFALAISIWKRRVGQPAAIVSAWTLALYPGASYWGSLPYAYASIFPLSMLLMAALVYLDEAPRIRLVWLSLGMGVAYLGYDLAAFYLPASLIILFARRRWMHGLISMTLQCAPLAVWTALSSLYFHFPVTNSNSASYINVLRAYFTHPDVHIWIQILANSPSIALDTFFGSNFLFLPILFIGLIAGSVCTKRQPISLPVGAVLATAVALFALLNFAPPYEATWVMRGTWISRLYQPVFPALALCVGTTWVTLTRDREFPKYPLYWLLALVTAGDALIVFGPILDDPLGISGTAYYRFYDHNAWHGVYRSNLSTLGRYPLGFGHRQPANLQAEIALGHSPSLQAREEATFQALEQSLADLRKTLLSDQRLLRSTDRALAENRMLLDEETRRSVSANSADATSRSSTLQSARSIQTSRILKLPDTAYLDAEQSFLPRKAPLNPSSLRSEITADQAEIQRLIEEVRGIEAEITITQKEISETIDAINRLRTSKPSSVHP